MKCLPAAVHSATIANYVVERVATVCVCVVSLYSGSLYRRSVALLSLYWSGLTSYLSVITLSRYLFPVTMYKFVSADCMAGYRGSGSKNRSKNRVFFSQ